MSIVTGITDGIRLGIDSGKLSRMWHPRELVAVMEGAADPVHMWRGNEPSGARDLVRSNPKDLTTAGAPSHLQAGSALQSLVVTFADSASGDSLDGDTATCNPGSNPWAFLLVYDNYTYVANGRSMCGNKVDANDGWRLQTLTGGLLRLIRDGVTAARSVDSTQNAEGAGAVLIRNIPGTEFGFRDHTGNTYTDVADNDACTSANPFQIGDMGGLICAGFSFGLAAYWETNIPTYAQFDKLVSFMEL